MCMMLIERLVCVEGDDYLDVNGNSYQELDYCNNLLGGTK